MMRNIVDIAWLAGLIEGEGTFGLWKGGSPTIAVHMVDRDVIHRAAQMFGTMTRGPYKPTTQPNSAVLVQERGRPFKDFWAASAHGSVAIGWMLTLYPFMGERRRAKIAEIVTAWRARPRRPNNPVVWEGRSAAGCHPLLPMRAKGLCNPCYMKARRARRKAAAA